MVDDHNHEKLVEILSIPNNEFMDIYEGGPIGNDPLLGKQMNDHSC